MRSVKQRNWAKGSYTVEAAIIIPLFLFMMAGAMKVGLDLYTETKCAAEQEALENLWEVETFYLLQNGKGILGK